MSMRTATGWTATEFTSIGESSLVMIAVDGAHCSWICLHCGHRNVPMVVHDEMTTDISMCSLCGVLQTESMVMAIKKSPMPFQTVQEDEAKINDEAILNGKEDSQMAKTK